jgi:transposase-like protein
MTSPGIQELGSSTEIVILDILLVKTAAEKKGMIGNAMDSAKQAKLVEAEDNIKYCQPKPRKPMMSGSAPIQALTQKILQMIIESIDDEQLMKHVKSKLIHPMLHSIFSQIYPYLMFLTVLMIVILIINLLCCTVFIMNNYFRRR